MKKQLLSLALMVLTSPAILIGVLWYSADRAFDLGFTLAYRFGAWLAEED